MRYLKYFELFKDEYFSADSEEYNNLPDDWVWGSRSDVKLDFNNYDCLLKYASRHGDPHLFKDKKLDLNLKDFNGFTIQERIKIYMDIYKNVNKKDKLKIYRCLELKKIEDLNVNKIGNFWSFKKNCAYSYGGSGSKELNHIITAVANVSDIDWESGFFSFLTYGTEQYECYMKSGSKVIITNIDNKSVNIESNI